jgi:hypothetical protein
MPCVGLDPAADQGGRCGQGQHGAYLRGGEHLAGQRPVAGQQFFRTPVMIRASSNSELPHGLGGSIKGIGFRGIKTPDRAAAGPAALLHNEEHGTAAGAVQRTASMEIPRQFIARVCLVGGPATRTGTSGPRGRASQSLAASIRQADIDHGK